jgi:hypothetical protein
MIQNTGKSLILSLLVAGTMFGGVLGMNLTEPGPPWTGSRSIAGGGLTNVGDADWGDVSVSWTITDAGNNKLQYQYVFAGFNAPAVSHFIMMWSSSCATSGTCVTDRTFTSGTNIVYSPGSYGPGPSNPGFPAGQSINGYKIDITDPNSTFTYTFLSTQVPMWGDLYLKGASDTSVFNTGLLAANRTSNDTGLFIAVPDTQVFCPDCGTNQIPEPGTYGLLGSALLALGAIRRLRG